MRDLDSDCTSSFTVTFMPELQLSKAKLMLQIKIHPLDLYLSISDGFPFHTKCKIFMRNNFDIYFSFRMVAFPDVPLKGCIFYTLLSVLEGVVSRMTLVLELNANFM